MSNLTLQLDDKALREATVQAITGVLSPETKERLLQQAIVALLTPSNNSWERGKSPIEAIFQEAVHQIAREEAKRLVAEDEPLRAKLSALLREAAEKVVSTNPDKLAERMSDAFIQSLRQN